MIAEIDTGTGNNKSPSQIVDADKPQESAQLRKEIAQKLKLPKSYKITAPHLNNITHTRKTCKKRERQLKQSKNNDIRRALNEISDSDNVMKFAMTFQDIDKSHAIIIKNREVLRSFESTNQRQKEKRTRNLRNKRALEKLGASERRYVQRYGGRRRLLTRTCTLTFQHIS